LASIPPAAVLRWACPSPGERGLDKLFEVIAYQAVVIIIEGIEVLGYDVSFFVFKQRALEVEDAHVIQSVFKNEVGVAFEVGGIVHLSFFLQVIDFLANPLEGL
jgi:hypothetical protein